MLADGAFDELQLRGGLGELNASDVLVHLLSVRRRIHALVLPFLAVVAATLLFGDLLFSHPCFGHLRLLATHQYPWTFDNLII